MKLTNVILVFAAVAAGCATDRQTVQTPEAAPPAEPEIPVNRGEVAAGRSGKHGHPGTGNPGYRIREEFTTNPRNLHEDGALAMARSQDPNSAGSQFYLCLGPQHRLDSGYTVFGQTIEGLEVISLLRAGDTIQSIRIEHVAN